MNFDIFISRIEEAKKRLEAEAYNITYYFDFTDEHRRAVLDDFEFILGTVHGLNKIHIEKDKWLTREDNEFLEPFKAFWLSRYLVLVYINKLNYSKIVNSFLTDKMQGKRMIISDLMKKLYSLKELSKILKVLRKAEKIKECAEVLNNYKIIVNRKAFNYFRKTEESFFDILSEGRGLIVMPFKKIKAIGKRTILKKEFLEEFNKHLETGDIILYRHEDYYNSPFPSFWNKVCVYCGDNKVVEIENNALRMGDIKQIRTSRHACILRPNVSLDLRERSAETLKRKSGISYRKKFELLLDKNLSLVEFFMEHNSALSKSLGLGGQYDVPRFNFIKLLMEKKLEFVYYIRMEKRIKIPVVGELKDILKTDLRSKWDETKFLR